MSADVRRILEQQEAVVVDSVRLHFSEPCKM